MIAAIVVYIYYFQRNLRVQIYERGFTFTRGNRTKSARWDEIADVHHQIAVTTVFFIKVPGSTWHDFIITHKNRKRIRLNSWLSLIERVGGNIQQMWVLTAEAAHAQVPC